MGMGKCDDALASSIGIRVDSSLTAFGDNRDWNRIHEFDQAADNSRIAFFMNEKVRIAPELLPA